MSDFEGRCLCGAVRFAITPPTLFFAHCHCRYCRDAHGAAFVSWVGAAESRFRFLPGSIEPRWYQSSQQSRRGFCPNCGTTLFFASTLCPGEIHVARPAIQDPIDREPQCHVFYDQHADWVEVGDGLPRYSSDEAGLQKYQSVRPNSDGSAARSGSATGRLFPDRYTSPAQSVPPDTTGFGMMGSEGVQTALEHEVARMIVSALNLESIAAEDIAPEAPLFGDGLGLDSIDALELALAISKQYAFELRSDDDDNPRIFASLRNLAQHIESRRAG